MEVKDYIVQIQVDTGDGNCVISTAYPVAPNMVLTAYHGLCDKNDELAKLCRIYSYWPHIPNMVDSPRNILEIAWSSKKLDAALLEVEFPHQNIALGQLSTIKPRDDWRWYSSGYAAVGRRHKLDDPTPLKGSCFSAPTEDHQFQLEVDANGPAKGWKGASGAPVFSNNGEVILGIIQSAEKNFDGKRFVATQSAALWDDSIFCQKLGESSTVVAGRELLNRRRIEIESILGRNPELCGKLSLELKRLKFDPIAIAEDVLTRWLLEIVPQRLVTRALSNIATAAISANKELAKDAQSLLSQVLPGIFGGSGMHTILQRAAASSPTLVSLSIGDSSLAEVIMASADGREADYRIIGDGELVGENQAPLSPESGIKLLTYEDVFRDLELKFAPTIRKIAKGNDAEKHEWVVKTIREALEDKAEDGATIYCVLPLDLATNGSLDYQRLCNDFPSLICIQISPENNEAMSAHIRAMRPVKEYYTKLAKNSGN